MYLCNNKQSQGNIKNINDELQISKVIFDNLYEGICITNEKGQTVYVNQAFEELSGIKSEEIMGFTGYDMMERNLQTNSCSDIVTKTGEHICVIIKYYKGKRCLATGSPIFVDGKLSNAVITLRALSDITSMEGKLKYTNVLKLRTQENKLVRVTPISKEKKIRHVGAANSVMTNIFKKAEKIALVDTPILLLGETGVGKDYLARYIHNESKGTDNPNFVKINCGAIPDNLLETELFGYEAGAFTSASKKGKIGFFELATDGTIFLDEIGDMPLNLQVKLLDVLQEKTIYRIGGIKPISIKARVIAATSVDLERKIKEGSFRKDLFYRLNVIAIQIPPLRKRKEDIPFYAKYFADEANLKYNKKFRLSSENLELMLEYDWPGNIRELRNTIERFVILSETDKISNKELKEYIISTHNNIELKEYITSDHDNKGNQSLNIDNKEKNPSLLTNGCLKEQLAAYEALIIAEHLKIYKSLKKTASALGVDASTLFRKISKYDIRCKNADLS
jgi:PAS domain S-box-containing protein